MGELAELCSMASKLIALISPRAGCVACWVGGCVADCLPGSSDTKIEDEEDERRVSTSQDKFEHKKLTPSGRYEYGS